MQKFVLVKARDGRIGPGSQTEWFSYHNYEDAFKDMVEDIEEEGGGEVQRGLWQRLLGQRLRIRDFPCVERN